MKKHAAAWIKGLGKYAIGFGLLGWVISRYWHPNPETGAPGLAQVLQGPIEFGWFAVAASLIVFGVSCQIVRWYILVRALDLPFTVHNAFRLGMVGVFFNTFFPGAVGGDVVKAIFIARDNKDRRTAAVATVIMDRAMGLFGLILFVAVLGSIAWASDDPRITGNPSLQRMIEMMAIIAGSSIGTFLLLGQLPLRRVERFSRRLKSIPKIGKSLAELWGVIWTYRQRMKAVAIGLGLSAASHFGIVFAFHAASRVFPPANPETDQATLAEHLVIAPIGFIVQALPISPGGVGVGEVAFAGLYKLSGRPESGGVVARLALRVVEWAIALIGLVILLRMKAHHELPPVEDADLSMAVEPPPKDGESPKSANE